MSRFSDDELYRLLTDTGRLLQDVEFREGEEYTLESILSEFGQDGAEPAPKPVASEEEGQAVPTPMPGRPEEAGALPGAEHPTKEEHSRAAEQTEQPAPVKQSDAAPRPQEAPPAEKNAKDPALLDTQRLRRAVADNMAKVMGPETRGDGSPLSHRPVAPVEKKPVLQVVEGGKADVRKEPPSDVFPEEPEGMHKVPLEQVMSQTVESVLDDDDAILDPPTPLMDRVRDVLDNWNDKLGAFFARFRNPDKPSVWEQPEKNPPPEREEPELDMEQAAREAKRICKKLHRYVILGAIPVILLIGVTVADALRALESLWKRLPWLCGALNGALLLAAALLAFPVWREMARRLKAGHVGCEMAACLTALVTLADCVRHGLSRGAGMAPFAAPAAVLLWICMRGLLLRADSRWAAFHLADIGGTPPYGVSRSVAGACKQRGTIRGFYRISGLESPVRRWQAILLPLYLAAAAVLSAVAALSRDGGPDMLWIWSVMLCAGVPVSLALADTLPLNYLNRRLVKSGSAMAGFEGARMLSRWRTMVITDDDLFPPGTIGLNGLKVYGEEIGKVVSYAASVSRACHSQLIPLFDQLLMAEGGTCTEVEDLHYYEEGGVGGTIHGENVTMGSAYFMRKKHVTLPQGLKLKTGVFLAVDGVLIAIFAIKYQPSRNVEWALRAMRRNRIVPVLAVRGANVTPGLLKRKFNLDAKPLYPDVSTRLALSDFSREGAESSGTVIYREGLMPYAETVVGSRRMVRAARWASALAYLGGLLGLLLAYYFTGVGAPELLDPARMLMFQGLWLLPTVLLGGMVKHY